MKGVKRACSVEGDTEAVKRRTDIQNLISGQRGCHFRSERLLMCLKVGQIQVGPES